jgi:murein DD-endopeptidase MepM/ murein hydrolase activator NlpD
MHRIRAYISTAVAVVLLSLSVVPAFAVSQADLQKHQRAADAAKSQAAAASALAKSLSDQAAALDKRIDALQVDVDKLDPIVAEAERNRVSLQNQVERLRRNVASLERSISKTQREYDRQSALLEKRMISAYREGDWYYLDILLGAKDFGDLIDRSEFINRVLESNRKDAIELDRTKNSLEDSKDKLQVTLSQVSVKRAEASAVEKRWRALRDQREAKVAAQQAVYGQKKSLLAATRKNIAKLKAIAAAEERESDRIASLLAARGGGSGIYNGVMQWPVPASYNITSPFGWRMHPILGYRRFHAGVDIAAASGSAIVASGSGTVIQAGYDGGYGNVTMVDHGNGVVSVYAHQSGIDVSVGSHVSKGERIGAVGSTGLSTGPHLHFEVRINGNPVNPMNYLK